MQQPIVIIIAGPTAVGKTSFAIQLAQHYNTEIISADSRQCYREMKIGVARPTDEELAAVKHYFIASHSVADSLNAAAFEQYALTSANEIFKTKPVAVMVGGTGLYIQAFCEGVDPMPSVPEEVRKRVLDGYALGGLIWLQKELAHSDPSFWEVAEQQNPRRLMRALEILYATGRSITEYRTQKKADRPFRVIKIGLELSKEMLYKNIHTRVDQMIEAGLVKEVEGLQNYHSLNALQTVGYREIFDYLGDHCSLETAVENIKIHTRHYAKRQMTWFKKDNNVHWMNPQTENLRSVTVMVDTTPLYTNNKTKSIVL